MDALEQKIQNRKPLLLLLLIGAVYFFLKYLTPLFAPVLLAMLFVTIFGPTLKRVQKNLHIHRQLGAVLLLLLATVILAGLVWILFSWIVGSLPGWIAGLEALQEDLIRIIRLVSQSMERAIGVDSSYLEEMLLSQWQEGMEFLRLQAVPGMLSQSLTYVKGAASLGGFLVTFIIASVLLAKDYDEIMNKLLEREEYHVLLEVICGIIRYIATFVKAQLIIMSTIAAVAAAVLGFSGIRHGSLWGILAGILDALPFVGTGIVLLPLAIFQFLEGSVWRGVICTGLYVVCIFLRELLEPRLIGKRIGVTPIAVLVSLYTGIQLFGIWGIIKGPLGFILIYETYSSLMRRRKRCLGGTFPVDEREGVDYHKKE